MKANAEKRKIFDVVDLLTEDIQEKKRSESGGDPHHIKDIDQLFKHNHLEIYGYA